MTNEHRPASKSEFEDWEVNFRDISIWTEGKLGDPDHNEDQMYADERVLILADGATDKTGFVYPSGKTGGHELAEIATRIAAGILASGYELADEVTAAVREFYRLNNPAALEDPGQKAASTLVVVRIVDESIVITQIGDTNVRITMADGSQQILMNDKLIDTENAKARSKYIETTLDELGRAPSDEELRQIVKDGREQIQTGLNTQYILQNTKDVEYGYGMIDGQVIPRNFSDGMPTNYVKLFTFQTNEVVCVELVSDGFYGDFPSTPDRAAYRNMLTEIHATDPDKYLKYLSTKPMDDATVVIAHLR